MIIAVQSNTFIFDRYGDNKSIENFSKAKKFFKSKKRQSYSSFI